LGAWSVASRVADVPVHFKSRWASTREWKVINGLHSAMDGRGALFGSADKAVHLTTRLGADWSGDVIKVEITIDHFRDLAQAMLDADPKAAMDAFGAALIIGPRRPVYDEDGREIG
jgi:hypothetical protein